MQAKYTAKEVKRFWGKADKESSGIFYNGTRCWEWTAYRNLHGYGRFWAGDFLFLTHRLSYELYFGSIPEKIEVCHHCDNPPCCNPNHLFLGTHQDNMTDMKRKGRRGNPAGELNPRCKLSDEKIEELRFLYKAGEKQTVLAKQFGISQAHVSSIIRHRSRV